MVPKSLLGPQGVLGRGAWRGRCGHTWRGAWGVFRRLLPARGELLGQYLLVVTRLQPGQQNSKRKLLALSSVNFL